MVKIMRQLPEGLQRKAILELNEIPERIPEDLQHIKDWLQKQPHINARTDDQWLVTILRVCKYSLEKAKQKLESYYTNKTLIPEYFTNRNPFDPKMQRLLKLGIFLPLQDTTDPSGPVIFFARNGVYDTSIDSFEDIYKLWFMICDILTMENDNFIVAGHCLIGDVKDVTLSHYAVPAGNLEKAFTMYQQSLPLRIRGFYLINTTEVYDICFQIIRPFMGEKLRKKVKNFPTKQIHELYAEYPQTIFPKEYGGDACSVQEIINLWKKKVESYADWFKDDEKYRTFEHLRPGGKPKTVYDVFGIEGAFRKLNID